MRRWIERQRNLVDFALSSLWRRKERNAALVLVYSLVVFLLASVMFLTSSLRREAALLLRESPEVVVQRLLAGRHDLIPASHAERLQEVRGVASVRGRLWGYQYDPVTRANYTVIVPEERLPAPQTVFLGRGVARLRGARAGDRFSLQCQDGTHAHFTVAGIFSNESELVSSDLVLLSETDFRQVFGVAPGLYTDLALRVRNPKEFSTVAAKIQGLLPDTRVILRDEILRTYDAVFDWRAGLLLVVFASSILAFGILAWDKAAGLSPEERREIGILKAVGWETSDVIALKAWQGTVVTLTSFLTGVLLAYAHVYFASAGLFAPILKGWATLYPRFTLVPHVDLYQLATLFLLTVLPYTGATVVPAWRAATVDPDAVMRV